MYIKKINRWLVSLSDLKELVKILLFLFEVKLRYTYGLTKVNLKNLWKVYKYWLEYLDLIFLCVKDIFMYLKTTENFRQFLLSIQFDFYYFSCEFLDFGLKNKVKIWTRLDEILELKINSLKKIVNVFASDMEREDMEYIWRFTEISELYGEYTYDYENNFKLVMEELENIFIEMIRKDLKGTEILVFINKHNLVYLK